VTSLSPRSRYALRLAQTDSVIPAAFREEKEPLFS